MKKKHAFTILTLILLIICFSVLKPVALPAAEKLGVLFVGAGEGVDYDPRWLDGYYDHLFPFFPPGFLAGRPGWEGETCYTHIHFADEAEATMRIWN